MGIVYEAFQESLGRHVAVKVLPRQTLLDPQQLRRFQREAQTAARLHHTNIVPVFGVGEHDGFHYIVMQLIEGAGLDDVLARLRQVGGRLRQPGKRPPTVAVQDPPAQPRSKAHVEVSRLARALAEGRFGQLHGFDAAASDDSDDLDQTRKGLAVAGQRLPPAAAATEEFCLRRRYEGQREPSGRRARLPRIPRRLTNRGSSVRLIGGALPQSASKWPRPCSTPIPIIRCTATSSRPICSWTRRAWPGSPISGWPRRWSTTT